MILSSAQLEKANMSGGITAIKGFDYQATVILDRLFEHFDKNGSSARVRPEGHDDLDLTWTGSSGENITRYEQIKKPHEDDYGNRKPEAWTVSQVIDDLLPNTIRHLEGNDHHQVWILGDEVDADVRSLIDAGDSAPDNAPKPYWTIVHRLARNDVVNSIKPASNDRTALMRWNIPAEYWNDPATASDRILTAFCQKIESVASKDAADQYRAKTQAIHGVLPSILARTTIECVYGSEEAVAQRVRDKLTTRFGLKPAIVEGTLFRNLRGFISDISKQDGRTFDNVELEYELRCVWPQMLAVKDAPPLPDPHIFRSDLTKRFTSDWTGKAVEAVGISGSGKTTLAAEAIAKSGTVDPQRLPLYIEVMRDTRLRDALAGVGFHLRRFASPNQFAVATETTGSDQTVLERLARSFASAPLPLLLIFDLVDGTCSDAFAQDLGRFVSKLPLGECRVLVFGQESAFRTMTTLDRETHGVTQTDVRGFSFEEFVKLVSRMHPNPDRAQMHEVYLKVTAGRSAGLFAKLAEALASAPSLEAMAQIAAQPSDVVLQFAEREKFSRVSSAARTAAQKLVCFALPFSRAHAEACFPEDNVGMAIREMTDLGLLRANDAETFELHETVRSGLEGILGIAIRQTAHKALAGWYHDKGLASAEILHLELAGDLDKAKERARASFLSGKNWGALAPWIIKHKAVSGAEVMNAIKSIKPIEGAYVFPELMRCLGSAADSKVLIELLRAQPERLSSEFQWGYAIAAAALSLSPDCLTDLVAFALQTFDNPQKQDAALSMILTSAKRTGAPLGKGVIAFFASASAEIKAKLLPLMFYGGRRESLQNAFAFLESPDGRSMKRSGARSFGIELKVTSKEDVIEILSALPEVQTRKMLAARSPLIGQLASLLWKQRRALQKYCVEILEEAVADKKVLQNAIRVLVFLMEPSICSLCDELAAKTQDTELRTYVSFIPMLVPALIDTAEYETRLFDKTLTPNDRAGAFAVLTTSNADMGALYQKMRAQEGSTPGMAVWDFLFLQLCVLKPFPEAIPLMKASLASGQGSLRALTPALQKLGALDVPEAAALLFDAVSHRDPDIRRTAASALQARRSRASLPALTAQFQQERDAGLVMSLTVAIVASGPTSMVAINHPSFSAPEFDLWKCILAARLHDESFAAQIVRFANDTALNWQVRRSAILAASRMPFDAALKEIMPVVMSERSTLTIDSHQALACHSALSTLVSTGSGFMREDFDRGRTSFIESWAQFIQMHMQGDLWPEGIPSGEDAAGWLFDRLTHHNWTSNDAAPDLILNELHVPLLQSAVLRALRVTDQPDLIENELPKASSLWLAIKCLMERQRSKQRDPDLKSRLRGLIAASGHKDKQILQNILNEMSDSATQGSPPSVPAPPDKQSAQSSGSRLMSYGDASKILNGDADCAPHDAAAPIVLDGLSKDQFEHLVRLADPLNDRYKHTQRYVPQVDFTAEGHSVARLQTTSSGSSEPAGAILRPAIAAANRFDSDIQWHQELMNGVFARTYIPRFLASLDAQNDSDLFYGALRANPDLLLPELCKAAVPVFHLPLDGRIAPLIVMYASSGNDTFFETLCALAGKVHSPEIDPALSALFHRWVQSFDPMSPLPQHDNNHELWRGCRILMTHPRFTFVKDWQSRLADVMRCTMAWFHKQDLARVLEQHPSPYIQIENMLFREEDWQHFREDEIERLDKAADKLFGEVSD